MSNAATKALPLAKGTFSKQKLYIMNIVLMLYHLTLSTSHISDSGFKRMHVLLITLTYITQIMAALGPTSRGLLR